MVSPTRASLGAGALRPLNAPSPIRVQTDKALTPALSQPLAVLRRGWSSPKRVVSVQDRWRIDDEWWRERPVARLYYSLLLEDGRLLTVFHDLIADGWFEQR